MPPLSSWKYNILKNKPDSGRQVMHAFLEGKNTNVNFKDNYGYVWSYVSVSGGNGAGNGL